MTEKPRTIIEAIQAAVESGTIQEPFTVADVGAVLRDYRYGSLQAALSRYSLPTKGRKPLLRRVGPGRYCLAGRRAQSL